MDAFRGEIKECISYQQTILALRTKGYPPALKIPIQLQLINAKDSKPKNGAIQINIKCI